MAKSQNARVNISGICQVNLVSWNVKSLNHPVKRRKVLSHLKQLNTDIAFLQETHLNTFDHFRLRGGWVGQLFHSNFHSKSRGTAILISKTVSFVMSKIEADPAGRYIIVVGRLNNTPVVLANIYAPNWDDSAFFTGLFSRIPNIDTHHLILGGDINCVLSPSLDRSSPKLWYQLVQHKWLINFSKPMGWSMFGDSKIPAEETILFIHQFIRLIHV